ncbi:tyrosine-type recombinase/integrase [Solibacillus silvestris]
MELQILNHSLTKNSMTTLLVNLQEKLDQAERSQLTPFSDFNDAEMIIWFLYQSEHLLIEQARSNRTIREYEKELNQFIEYLMKYHNEMGLDVVWSESFFRSLAPRHIRLYQEWLKENSPYVKSQRAKGKSGYSVATLTRKTTIIKQFLSFLYEKKYVTAPLHEGLKSVQVRSDDRPNRDMGTKDVGRIMQLFINTENIFAFTIIQTLVTTGLRNEELCKLTVQDLRKSISGNPYLAVIGKGNKRRDIPLRENIVKSIDYYRIARQVPPIADAQPQEPLFPTARGLHFSPSGFSQWLSRQIESIADDSLKHLKITPHTFRHAFAIISHENNADVYDIMRSLGHEKIDTTMIYLQKIFEQENHTSHLWKNDILKYL